MNRRELERAIEREVESWPGVTVTFVEGSKHPKARFSYNDQMLSRPYAGTPSDGSFGLHQCLGDMRRVMRQLGACRDKPEPSREEEEAPYRKPNDGAAKRPDPPREKAEPEPDIADKLVAAGAATPEQVEAAKAADMEPRKTLFERMADAAAKPDPEPDTKRQDLEAAIAAIEDGVYFGLDDKIYHAVPALGSTSLSSLLVSPGDFWRGSWLDPDRPELDEEATKAQVLGKAYHCARLEPEIFHSLYCRALDKSDMPPRSLLTSEDMKLELKERALKMSGSSIEQARRLAEDGFPVERLWHIQLAEWKAASGDKIAIPAQYWDDIGIDMERIRAVPEIAALLTGGAAEVSIFWTDDRGMRCKARFDYLKPDSWTDFKTFENSRRKAVDKAIAEAVQYNRYYIQAGHYRDAAEAVRGGLDIRGESNEAQRALIYAIRESERPLNCWYVFQQKGRVPNLFAKHFRFSNLDPVRENEIRILLRDGSPGEQAIARDALSQPSQLYRKAVHEITVAKSLFAHYSQVYSPGEPWAPVDPIGDISDLDFHPNWLEARI